LSYLSKALASLFPRLLPRNGYFERCRDGAEPARKPEDGAMKKTMFPMFVGEAPTFPPPPRVPAIEAVPARAGAWVMAAQTYGTVPPGASK
jgi:hypothetical protein